MRDASLNEHRKFDSNDVLRHRSVEHRFFSACHVCIGSLVFWPHKHVNTFTYMTELNRKTERLWCWRCRAYSRYRSRSGHFRSYNSLLRWALCSTIMVCLGSGCHAMACIGLCAIVRQDGATHLSWEEGSQNNVGLLRVYIGSYAFCFTSLNAIVADIAKFKAAAELEPLRCWRCGAYQ